MWRISQRLYLGDYDSGLAALAGLTQPVDPTGEWRPFAGVVSLCTMPLRPTDRVPSPTSPETEWLYRPISDGGRGEQEFERTLQEVRGFFGRRVRLGNVLIHCAAGLSRSVSTVAALLCEEGSSPEEAFGWICQVKSRALSAADRPDPLIAPAIEFQRCLKRLYCRGSKP